MEEQEVSYVDTGRDPMPMEAGQGHIRSAVPRGARFLAWRSERPRDPPADARRRRPAHRAPARQSGKPRPVRARPLGRLLHDRGTAGANPGASEHLYGIVDVDGELAGIVSLLNLVRGPFRSANVGYWVDDGRRGRGLATGAVQDVAERAFGELGLHRLEAYARGQRHPRSASSRRHASPGSGLAPRYLHIAGAWRVPCSSSGPWRIEEGGIVGADGRRDGSRVRALHRG